MYGDYFIIINGAEIDIDDNNGLFFIDTCGVHIEGRSPGEVQRKYEDAIADGTIARAYRAKSLNSWIWVEFEDGVWEEVETHSKRITLDGWGNVISKPGRECWIGEEHYEANSLEELQDMFLSDEDKEARPWE